MASISAVKSLSCVLLLGTLLIGCGQTDTLAGLEEKQALLGESDKPVLTKPKPSQELYTGESLSLDFNNEKFGHDDGMRYLCTYDVTIDKSKNDASECSSLPDLPIAKFDGETGKFYWGPLATPGTYEFHVTGTNKAGSDSQTFVAIVTQNKLPTLQKIRDQRTDANRTLIIGAINLNKIEDPSTVFACYFDAKVDESVEATAPCDSLPGEEKDKFDSKTGILTWTPPNSAVGPYELAISVSNTAGTDREVFPLIVEPDPNTPVLTKVDSEYLVYVGSTFTMDLNNERIGSDRGMTYSCRFDSTVDGKVAGSRDCDSLPDSPDVKFDSLNGKLRWGPLATEGNFEIKLTGENIAGYAEQIFLVRVVTNRKPVMARLLDQRISANRTFTLSATNTNPDANVGLFYSCTYDTILDGVVNNGTSCDALSGVPATKLNTQTGAFSWTPNNAAIGNYEFSIKAVNNSGTVEQVFKVIVDPDPDTPVLTKVSSMITAYIGDTLVLDFKNEKTGSDTGMTYFCSFDSVIDGLVTNGTNCDSLPDGSGNKFSTAAGVLNWGALASSGLYEILIRGQNTAGLDEYVFTVRVQQNQAPRLSRILDKQLEVGQSYLVTPVNATALIGDQVSYSCRFDSTIDSAVSNTANLCSSLPGQPSIKFDSITGMLNWTPDNTMVGSYEFKLKATNSYGSDEKIFVLVVSPSTAKKVKLAYIRNVSIITGESVSVDAINTLTSSDAGVDYSCFYDAVVDGDVASMLSCDLLPGTPNQKFNPTTGALNWAPNLSSQTELELKIVGAKQGDSDEKTFVVSFATQRFGDVGNSAIIFDPNSWDFGSVAINQTSDGKSVTLTNNSTSPIYIGQIVSSNSDFILNWSACPSGATALASQATCVINVSFQPSTSNQLGSALAVRFGKNQASSLDYNSVMGLSGRGVGSLTFAGLQTISAVTHNSMRLNWIANSQAASYLVFQVVSGNLVYLQTLVNTGGTVNSVTLSNLMPSTAYIYRVRATDFVGVVDSNTRNVTATTNANQAPSVSSGPASWVVSTGRLIDPVDFNDTFTSSDLDRDGDVISYTCQYDNTIDTVVAGNASSCASIVNINATNVTFNQFSGILSNWKPSASALGTSYEFKVTAIDFYGSTSTSVFSTTVTGGAPLISTVGDYIFPNNYKRSGDSLTENFNNIRFDNSDTDMSYSCSFRTLTIIDSNPATACSSLPGTFTLHAATGALNWSLTSASVGAYALTVTGTNLVGNHSRTFKVSVLPAIDDSQRLFHIDARFAFDSRGGQNSISTTSNWGDILTSPSATNFGALNNFSAASSWIGSTASDNPMAINFDGTNDFVNFPNTNFTANAAIHFDTWVFQGVNSREKVIFSQGDSSERGVTLTDRRLWLGNGTNSAYAAAVLADSPRLYWQFTDISGGTIVDSSGNNRTGLLVNSTTTAGSPPVTTVNITGNVDDAVFNLAGAGIQTSSTGHLRPTTTPLTLGADWTIETWFSYPFVGGCASGYCTLARGTTVQDSIVLVQNGTMLLGIWKSNSGVATPANGFLSSGYSLQSLSRGWHHLVAVGTGTSTTFYIDGVAVGTPVAYKPVNDLFFIGGNTFVQPFGRFDEFAVYGTALSANRILAHYTAGSKAACTFSLNDDLWYHIAGTIEDTTNTGTLYLNGAQVCSFSKSASKPVAGSLAPLTLGRSSVGANTSWLGRLSSLIFYNDASISNISSNYAATSSLYSPQLAIAPAGLRLWLRADQGLWQNSARDLKADAEGHPILVWEDQSGTGGDMAVRAAANQTTARPTLNLSGKNGQPVVVFDGIDDNLQNTINYGVPNTVFIVARYNGATPRGRILAGSTNNWILGWYAGTYDRFFPNAWVTPNAPTADASWMIYAGDHSNSSQRLFRNNQVIMANALANTMGPAGLNIGSYQGTSEWSTAEVAEIIVYDRVLTTLERQAIFSYLNLRYAIY